VDEFEPEDLDPLRRRSPKPIKPQDLNRGPSLDIVALLRQVIVRVERLEEDMRKVKEKLNL
jgi:hypothetical protein